MRERKERNIQYKTWRCQGASMLICRCFPCQESHPPVSAVGHRACVCACVCIFFLFLRLVAVVPVCGQSLLFVPQDHVGLCRDFLGIQCVKLSRAPSSLPHPLPLRLPCPSLFRETRLYRPEISRWAVFREEEKKVLYIFPYRKLIPYV